MLVLCLWSLKSNRLDYTIFAECKGFSGMHICHFEMLICCFFLHFFFWKRTRTFFLGLSNINRRMISSKPLSPSLLFVQISVCNFQWYALYLTFFIFMTSLLDLTLIIICVNCALLTYNQSPNTLVILPLQLSWWSLASNTLLPQSVVHIPFSACMLNCFSHVRLFVTPWTMAQGSSVHGILQARILEWVVMPSSRGSSQPRDRTCVSYVSCNGKQVLYH